MSADYGLHEVLHLASVLQQIWDYHIVQHQSVKKLKIGGDKKVAELLERIGEGLHDFYQHIGSIEDANPDVGLQDKQLHSSLVFAEQTEEDL